MKNKLLIFLPVLFMGVSLTACTVLSDLGIGGKSDITKMAKYKNEVSLTQFLEKIKTSTKDSEYAQAGYKMGDSKLMAGFKVTATQKLTNDSFKNKTKNSAEVKANFSADGTYDKDNNSIKATASASYSASEKNAILGEASSKYENKFDMTVMPNGKEEYAISDNKNQMYISIETGEEFDLNSTMSFGLYYIMNAASMYIPTEFDESEFNKLLESYGLSLKYYDDDNVLTVKGTMKHSFDIYANKHIYIYDEDGNYVRTEEEKTNFAIGNIDVDFTLQFKVVKVIKLRAAVDGSVTVDYFKDNSPYGVYNYYTSLLGMTGFTGGCEAGDKEVITVKAEAGINLESKDVTNKLPDLSTYKNCTAPSEENGYSEIGYAWGEK